MENITITHVCPVCHKEYSVNVKLDEYIEWMAGELIQYAMPSASPIERKQLIAEMCPECLEVIYYYENLPEDEDVDSWDC